MKWIAKVWRKRDAVSFVVLVFVSIFLCDALSFSYDFGDPALMLFRAQDLDLTPSPSGHPLFYLLMHLPAKIGAENVMATLNMMFGIVSASLLARAATRLSGRRERAWLEILVAISILISHTLLIKSLSLDIYALQALVNASIFYAAIRAEKAQEAKETRRFFLIFALFLGLQVANHLWAVFLLPAAVWWGISLLIRKRISLAWLSLVVFASVVAAGAYSIPSFMMMAEEGFGAWYQASLGGDEVGGKFFGYTLAEMPKALLLGMAMMVFQFPLLIWCAPVGVRRIWRANAPLVTFFALVFVPNALASIFYKESHAYEVMITHYQVIFLFAAAALPQVLVALRRRWRCLRPLATALVILIVVPVGVRVLAYRADKQDLIALQNARDFPIRDESMHFVAGLPAPAGHMYAIAIEWYFDQNKELEAFGMPENALDIEVQQRHLLGDWSYWAPLHRAVEDGDLNNMKVYLDSKSAEHAAFWDSPDLFDGKHYVVSEEPIFAKPARARGAVLVPEFYPPLHGPFLYRVERAD